MPLLLMVVGGYAGGGVVGVGDVGVCDVVVGVSDGIPGVVEGENFGVVCHLIFE